MTAGEVRILEVDSKVLRGNPLRDPHVRRVPVYLPPGYDKGGRFPVILCLAGFTGYGRMFLNTRAWEETLPERMDRLIAAGSPPAILVMADGFTKYGGSQYVNSPATGRYEDHLVRELVPGVDREFRTTGRRGVMGKSSGGFGAIRLAMRHPRVFSAVACHSGDMGFELCYAADFPKVCALLPRHGGTVRGFYAKWFSAEKKPGDAFPILNTFAMASCYSPKRGAPGGFELPFNPRTSELIPAVWRRWRAFDPLVIARKPASIRALRGMDLVFIDCGARDEFHLQFGARRFSEILKRAKVRHMHEEFPDGHMNIPFRYDRSLPLLARALSGKRRKN